MPAVQTLTAVNDGNGTLVTWAALANGDTGLPFQTLDHADMCVAFTGTFGSGGTVVFEGSNDGTNYFTLTDPQTSAISKTSAAMEQVIECPRYVRPHATAGDGTTALVCTMWTRKGVVI